MRLQRLTLSNFMGTRDLTLDLDGQSATIRGTNATGKTTTFSAFTWLLFGKDAAGSAAFDIKTIDSRGEPLHNLEHSVEAEFALDDELLTLRKTYVEVYTKKRGASRAEFTGHRVDHHVDGVPAQKKEFDARIAEIAPEAHFRLLTDPDAFHSLHWEKRRALLLDVCGDVSLDEVIAANADLADLPSILGKRSVDDARKVVDAKRKEINRELSSIPVRIDEATQSIDEQPKGSKKARKTLDAQRTSLREKRDEITARLAAAREDDGLAERQMRVREIDVELRERMREIKSTNEDALADAFREHTSASQAARLASVRVDALDADIREARERIARRETHMAKLRERFALVAKREPPESVAAENCPTCGQRLPEAQIEQAHAKALADFLERRADELEGIRAEGRAEKESREAYVEKAEALEAERDDLRAEIVELHAAAESAREAHEAIESAAPDPMDDPAYVELLEEKHEITKSIDALRDGASDATGPIRAEIAAVDREIDEIEAALGRLDSVERTLARISDLEASEKRLASEYEETERHLWLLDTFLRTKADMLTERINARFEITRWRLFEEQINEGVKPACTATVDGVPYGGGLNRAGRINSGLDVIRVLQQHFDFHPPVFIDEAESVVVTLPLDTQVIRLVVDERYPALDVTLDTEEAA